MNTPAAAPPFEFLRLKRDLGRLRTYLDDRQPAAACAVGETITVRFPQLALGWFYRSLAEAADDRLAAAVASAERAAALEPERAEAWSHLARCHALRGDAHAAVVAARKAAALPLNDAPLADHVGAVLTQFGDAEAAIAPFERAVELDPNNPVYRYNAGAACRALGRRDAALAWFEQALELAPAFPDAHWSIVDLEQPLDAAKAIARMEAARPQLAEGSRPAAMLDFALFRAHDVQGDSAAAEAALTRANGAMRASVRNDGDWEARLFAQLEQHGERCFPQASQDVLVAPGDAPVPIFIVGMPRSGTTLVERLLGNHPEVRLGGELQDFNVCVKRELGIDVPSFMDQNIVTAIDRADWRRVGEAYRARLRERFGPGGWVTDKLPGNSFYTAAIAAALPEARIIHVVRDPLDTCFAIWTDVFGAVYPYAYDQDAIAAHYVRYAAWMRRCESALPKRIFPLRYEQLVSVPGLVTRALYRFCGLDWIDGAEDPTANDRQVATASSVLVRERIHARGVGAWQRYAAHVAPMRDRLVEAGLMSRD